MGKILVIRKKRHIRVKLLYTALGCTHRQSGGREIRVFLRVGIDHFSLTESARRLLLLGQFLLLLKITYLFYRILIYFSKVVFSFLLLLIFPPSPAISFSHYLTMQRTYKAISLESQLPHSWQCYFSSPVFIPCVFCFQTCCSFCLEFTTLCHLALSSFRAPLSSLMLLVPAFMSQAVSCCPMLLYISLYIQAITCVLHCSVLISATQQRIPRKQKFTHFCRLQSLFSILYLPSFLTNLCKTNG